MYLLVNESEGSVLLETDLLPPLPPETGSSATGEMLTQKASTDKEAFICIISYVITFSECSFLNLIGRTTCSWHELLRYRRDAKRNILRYAMEKVLAFQHVLQHSVEMPVRAVCPDSGFSCLTHRIALIPPINLPSCLLAPAYLRQRFRQGGLSTPCRIL